jgi:hypothetical protein
MADLTPLPSCGSRPPARLRLGVDGVARSGGHRGRVDRHARQILREVDQLARTYGWREPDILALGPARRRAYLGLVAS